MQPLVLVMETEVVMQPLQKVTQVLVVETMNVYGDQTIAVNETAPYAVSNGIPSASMKPSAGRARPTALASTHVVFGSRRRYGSEVM